MPLQQWPRLPAPDCVYNNVWETISVKTMNNWDLLGMPPQGTSSDMAALLGCANL